jgi:hypothetical protein
MCDSNPPDTTAEPRFIAMEAGRKWVVMDARYRVVVFYHKSETAARNNAARRNAQSEGD